MRLDGKVAIVTGAGSGLGREVALALAADGARLALASNVTEQNEAVAADCRELGVDAIDVTVDVREEDDVKRLFQLCAAELGRVDVLVNAAGVDVQRTADERRIENMRLEDWRLVQEVNVTGVFLSAREAIPHMRAAGGGSILNFSGFGTLPVPMPEWGAYMTTKGEV
jgi:NAD(P)-dependent dehydrogenase (short-subunit alcohol dehydrogenase family)